MPTKLYKVMFVSGYRIDLMIFFSFHVHPLIVVSIGFVFMKNMNCTHFAHAVEERSAYVSWHITINVCATQIVVTNASL